MSSVTARRDLTNNQWERLRRWLPEPSRLGRPIARSRRTLVNGIAWRVRTGSPWRDLPAQYGPWATVYWLFCAWQRSGTWLLIWRALQALARDQRHLTWEVGIDSTTARAHLAAAGARRRTLAGEPADHALGRSRGGWSTKLHLVVDTSGHPLAALVTAGQANDSPQMIPLLEAVSVARIGGGRARRHPDRVLADRAYSCRSNREWLRRKQIKATIPEPADQIANRQRRGARGGRPPAFDADRYKDRSGIERAIARLKQHRAVATRYDKLAVRYLATVQIAIIINWLRDLPNTA
ncbi:IS5 family transposase [Glycomyces tritici]|uniref:IS5 family transposase n=1 Tax=Glycomyces tritici TaxID=2665176 RepID=A0ABT7YXY2_9ACTN|nr:IS5 family transposase [Glycomyces tritici]MDN3241802.1 IS5 family transposase [Glycomyces tritici]MDN3242583.1 IS5 family transposase [Glycomyces tritici]MDN3242818.1 IS5 family transposase [Glycomyces tritici]MDN3243505.1 IS5 family transposase [Glycomyces tritici]